MRLGISALQNKAEMSVFVRMPGETAPRRIRDFGHNKACRVEAFQDFSVRAAGR
ncbi:MAG TPA: hypothetical protein VK400_13235 [Pyrinomonadaceae bacterium]|nr:hypothetical protein [Pyrinomonadaceae bacterium]